MCSSSTGMLCTQRARTLHEFQPTLRKCSATTPLTHSCCMCRACDVFFCRSCLRNGSSQGLLTLAQATINCPYLVLHPYLHGCLAALLLLLQDLTEKWQQSIAENAWLNRENIQLRNSLQQLNSLVANGTAGGPGGPPPPPGLPSVGPGGGGPPSGINGRAAAAAAAGGPAGVGAMMGGGHPRHGSAGGSSGSAGGGNGSGSGAIDCEGGPECMPGMGMSGGGVSGRLPPLHGLSSTQA